MKQKINMKSLSVRISEEEYDKFHKMCHLEYKSMAEVVCSLIRKHIEKKLKEAK